MSKKSWENRQGGKWIFMDSEAAEALEAAISGGRGGGGPPQADADRPPSRKSNSSTMNSKYDPYSTTPTSFGNIIREMNVLRYNEPKKRPLMPGKGKDWKDKRSADVLWKASFCGRGNKKKRRALMIEYHRSSVMEGEKKLTRMEAKVKEVGEMAEFEAVCSMDRKEGSILRVFHVQNFPEAANFLMQKYKMNDRRVGWPSIKDWLYHRAPERRAGKAVPMAATFNKIVTPGLSKIAWSMDCVKTYPVGYKSDSRTRFAHPETKIAELLGYFDDYEPGEMLPRPDNPWNDQFIPTVQNRSAAIEGPESPTLAQHVKDIFSQRLSCYVQWVNETDENSPKHGSPFVGIPKRRQASDVMDLGNTIIVFDNSESLSTDDTMIPAHGEEERLWRGPGVSVYDASEEDDNEEEGGDNPKSHDQKFANDFMQKIIETIFMAVARSWEETCDASWDHVSILQDRIYSQPADETRAPEMFRDSALWLLLSKLMSYHLDCIQDVQEGIGNFDEDDHSSETGRPQYDWLSSVLALYTRLDGYIEADLVTSSDKLQNLMYMSVGIRDSRASLILSESMWRLSWVTFIFLPLTAISGAFGMNVDILADNPWFGWYFIVSVPFMLGVFLLWYVFKHSLAKRRRTFTNRGNYERLFQELSRVNSDLWTTHGPRLAVKPKGFASRIRWRFMMKWTKNVPTSAGAEIDDDGTWTTFKKYLIRRWTPAITYDHNKDGASEKEMDVGVGDHNHDISSDVSFISISGAHHGHFGGGSGSEHAPGGFENGHTSGGGAGGGGVVIPAAGIIKTRTEPVHHSPHNMSDLSLNRGSVEKDKSSDDIKSSSYSTAHQLPSHMSPDPTTRNDQSKTEAMGGMDSERPEDLAFERSSTTRSETSASRGFRRHVRRLNMESAKQTAQDFLRDPRGNIPIFSTGRRDRMRGSRKDSDNATSSSNSRAQSMPTGGSSEEIFNYSPEDTKPRRGKLSRKNTGSSVHFKGDEPEQEQDDNTIGRKENENDAVTPGGESVCASWPAAHDHLLSTITEAESMKRTPSSSTNPPEDVDKKENDKGK